MSWKIAPNISYGLENRDTISKYNWLHTIFIYTPSKLRKQVVISLLLRKKWYAQSSAKVFPKTFSKHLEIHKRKSIPVKLGTSGASRLSYIPKGRGHLLIKERPPKHTLWQLIKVRRCVMKGHILKVADDLEQSERNDRESRICVKCVVVLYF